MFFQDITPDTSGYMIAGYTVFFVVTAVYLTSLFLRSRNLKRDLSTLQDLQKESELTAAKPPAASKTAASGKTKTKAKTKAAVKRPPKKKR